MPAPIDITATKPTKQPGNPAWATDGGTRVEPSGGHKATGFTTGERPTYQLLNWLIGFLTEWAKYGEDAADELDGAKLSRKGAGASTPQGMIGTLSSERNLTDDCGASSTRWATVWAGIVNATISYVIGATMILTDKLLTLDATADVRTTARKNTITSLSMAKCTALLRVQSNALIGTGGTVAGFNVTSAALVTLSTKHAIQITIAQDFATSDYIPIVSFSNVGAVVTADLLCPVCSSGGILTIQCFDLATGALKDIDTNDKDIFVSIFGVQ